MRSPTRLLNHQKDEPFLASLGEEVVRLIKDRSYRDLANRFGYALAFGKDPADAIEADIALCLSQASKDAEILVSGTPLIEVRRFKRDESIFIAVVECRLALASSKASILAELIVTSRDGEEHVTLEQISCWT